MADVKDVLRLTAAIYEKTGLPFGNIAGMASDVFLGKKGSDQESEKDKFARAQVERWWEMVADLMDEPMSNESKKRTAMDQIRSDYIRNFGRMPKERWVETWHATIVMGVKGDMAYTGDKS